MEIKNKLKDVLNTYQINLNEEQLNKINDFNNYMLNYNNIHNLTSITEENDVIFKHYLDSLLGLHVLEDLFKKCNYQQLNNKNKVISSTENNQSDNQKSSNSDKIIDIGAGAGFPSIPLCIADSNLNITALDSVNKKTNFINLAKNEHKIDNLSVINGRIEDYAKKTEYREQFDFVISRAVAELPTLIEYSAPMLKNNGKIIAYKGSNYTNELEKAKNAMKLLDCTLEKVYEFKIEEMDTIRYILIINKNSKISTKYPRSQNKPRLQPL